MRLRAGPMDGACGLARASRRGAAHVARAAGEGSGAPAPPNIRELAKMAQLAVTDAEVGPEQAHGTGPQQLELAPQRHAWCLCGRLGPGRAQAPLVWHQWCSKLVRAPRRLLTGTPRSMASSTGAHSCWGGWAGDWQQHPGESPPRQHAGPSCGPYPAQPTLTAPCPISQSYLPPLPLLPQGLANCKQWTWRV